MLSHPPRTRASSLTKRERDRRHDHRRRNDQPWRRWYKTARWQLIRATQLQRQPLCERCLKARPRRLTPASVVHHLDQHHGDEAKFWAGPFTSSCKPCHDAAEQGIEARGYDASVGPDGVPTDPLHPFNR